MGKINPRSFRGRDSALLHEMMAKSVEIRFNIEALTHKEQLPIEEIKPSIIDTELLYKLVSCYVAQYDSLLQENLIKTGNPNSGLTIH